MKLFLAIALLGISSVGHTAALVETVIGNVVAVERNFGTADQEACLAKLTSEDDKHTYFCKVKLMTSHPLDRMLKNTEVESFGFGLSAFLMSSVDGYTVVVTSQNNLKQLNLNQVKSLLAHAFTTGDFGRTELKSTLETVK